jgi:hypothetical protein
MRTLGELLRPTKGSESYPVIARRANEWFRRQVESGREMSIARMSSEQVRRIFEDHTVRPRREYLEAIAAAQGIDPRELYEIAGYPVASISGPTDPVEAVAMALRAVDMPEEDKAELVRIIDQYLASRT